MFCEKCQYITDSKSNYNKHLKTQKHLKTNVFSCLKCKKTYKCRQSLWRHQKTHEDRIVDLINQNKELRQQLTGNNTIIQNITHTTQNFNLNIFLNETCKDAINMRDFIGSLEVQVKDLEETGQLGFINGITRIFMRGLQELEQHKRPIHCSDLKREIIYIKDQDNWERENDERIRLKKAIYDVSVKNLRQIPKWQQFNPDYLDITSPKNTEYINLIGSSFGGSNEEEITSKYDKIIKRIAKETTIHKESCIKN
jgi:hypothetical protein